MLLIFKSVAFENPFVWILISRILMYFALMSNMISLIKVSIFFFISKSSSFFCLWLSNEIFEIKYRLIKFISIFMNSFLINHKRLDISYSDKCRDDISFHIIFASCYYKFYIIFKTKIVKSLDKFLFCLFYISKLNLD